MLKVELHAHTADDPQDLIPHTTVELIDRAVSMGFDALAITLHDLQFDLRRFTPYARERGVKGGATLDHRGGGKLDHPAVEWRG